MAENQAYLLVTLLPDLDYTSVGKRITCENGHSKRDIVAVPFLNEFFSFRYYGDLERGLKAGKYQKCTEDDKQQRQEFVGWVFKERIQARGHYGC